MNEKEKRDVIRILKKRHHISNQSHEYTEEYENIPKGSNIIYIDKKTFVKKSGYLTNNDEGSIFHMFSRIHRKTWTIYPIHYYIFYRHPEKNGVASMIRKMNEQFVITKLDHG